MLRDHFFEGLLRLIHIGGGIEFVGMVHGTNDQFLFHPDIENSATIFEFFIPLIIGICIGEVEDILDALAMSKNDAACLPVDTWVVAFELVVSKVYVLGPKVGDSEVDALAVFSNGHSEFCDFSDITALVSHAIGVIDRDRDHHLSGFESVFLYIGAIDRASSTPAIYECFCC